MKLENKVAIVTGAASGFGKAIAETFAREGARVVVADINGQGARDVAQGIGTSAVHVAVDVSKRAEVDAMVGEAVRAFGGLDIMVNNAGTTHRNRPMLDVGEDEFDRIFAVNVKSIYLAALAAVITMTKSMAAELAPRKIRVCAINPVAGETPLLADFMGADTPENRARFIATIPLGRLSLPSDIANAALFLASPESSMITGVALEVDGGRCV
jgi:3-oxoacyl-[acyl-carrier protein] reductase